MYLKYEYKKKMMMMMIQVQKKPIQKNRHVFVPVNRDDKQEISSVWRNLKPLKPPEIQYGGVGGWGVEVTILLDFKLIS